MSQLGTHITGIKTEMEASTRFMKDFMDYVKDLPAIHKAVAQFQKEEIDFLKNKLDLTQQIAQAQQSGGGASAVGANVSQGQTVSTGPGGAVTVNTNQQQQQRQSQQQQTQQSQSPAAIPAGGGTPPPVSQGGAPTQPLPGAPPAPGVMSGLPVSRRMQNLLDYRAQLGSQITDPRVLFEHMRQRGYVTEGVEDNQPKYTVQVGKQRVSAEELMNSPTLQSQALDHLAEQTIPAGNENGSALRQGKALTGVASNLLRSLGPGTSVAENVAGVSEAAGSIGAMGGLGGLAGSLGAVALPLGIAAGVMGLVEGGGQAYQNLKNLGQTHNGGASAGFSYEMGIRMMALNPFINTEQARQITMGALNLGYTGKEFDTVTQFMAQNLTDMNMAQPLDEPVLTPTGWVKMGELAVGDSVIGGDGNPTVVRAIHERGPLEVFEVKFSDGTSTRSSADHLWSVYTGRAKENPLRLKRLHQIINSDIGNCQYSIPLFKKVVKHYSKENTKSITSTSPAGIETCRCITVENPDGLYVTKGFTVTHNSVADSVKLLQTNVVQGGQSIQSLGQQLQGLQALSGSSTSTNTQLQQAYEQYSSNLVSQGVAGDVAGAVAQQWAGWNQNKVNGQPNPLAGAATTNTLNSLISSPAFLQQLGSQFAPGVMYPGVVASISQSGGPSGLSQDVQSQMIKIVKMFPPGNTAQSRQNAISNFMLYMNSMGVKWSEKDAENWYNALNQPTNQLPYQQAQRAETAADQTSVNPKPYSIGAPNQYPLADDPTGMINPPGPKDPEMINLNKGLSVIPESGKFTNPELTSLFQKYGYDNIVVYDNNGKVQPLDFSNKDLMYGLANGSWKIAIKNSSGKASSPASIDDWRTGLVTPGGTVTSSTGSAGTTSSSTSGGGTFDLTPAAQQLLKLLPGGGTVGTSPNTQAANTGTNGVTPNSAPQAYPSH